MKNKDKILTTLPFSDDQNGKVLLSLKPEADEECQKLSLPFSLVSKIQTNGKNGEILKVKTGAGIVYLVLDSAFKKWCRKSTGESRVCFTVSEMKMLCEAYPNPEMPYIFDEVIRPLIRLKQEWPGSRIDRLVSREKEVPF